MKCICCNEKIRVFTQRDDYDARQLHHTCWLLIMEQLDNYNYYLKTKNPKKRNMIYEPPDFKYSSDGKQIIIEF
jgi:hypothetical protein